MKYYLFLKLHLYIIIVNNFSFFKNFLPFQQYYKGWSVYMRDL